MSKRNKYETKPRICKQCNKEFKVIRRSRTHFCSRECSSNYRIKTYIPPETNWNLENWIILEFDHREKRLKQTGCVNYWKVQCINCGLESVRLQDVIKQDSICQNCKGRSKGESGLKRLYKNYERSANYRNIPFTFDLENFKLMTSSPCHYCGILPHKFVDFGNTKINDWGQYQFNGIDQIIAGKGYLPENCLPCCAKCNIAKGTMSYDNFINYLDRVTKFRYPSSITDPFVSSGAIFVATIIGGLIGPK